MKINFVGNDKNGYVGEVSDENHLVRELRSLGHDVTFVPRDVWKAYIDGHPSKADWVLPRRVDINIMAKWPHFNDEKYVEGLRLVSGAPVLYWVWDYMADDNGPSFNSITAAAADLYLTNEGGLADLAAYQSRGVKPYYFPFDCADMAIPTSMTSDYEYEVVFFGSKFGKGDRVEWLKAVKDQIDLTIFSWNWPEWEKEGFKAKPAVWGAEFNRTVARSKICLQFSVTDHSWGYWSNRVGKVLVAGGFLLARYAPGMELFLRDGAAYFSSPAELVTKVDYYLVHEGERKAIAQRGKDIGQDRFTSRARVKELTILMERFLKGALV